MAAGRNVSVQSSAGEAGRRATAFGLDVRSTQALALLHGCAAAPTGRPLELTILQDHATLDWPDRAELVCDERQPDGSENFRIKSHPEAGYLIAGPGYGAHRLSADGRHLTCLPGGLPAEVWQRLLVAQVLPFAALLQGLEVFHASAVLYDGRAIALLGPSHSGKTSLALALCNSGAAFLADDVLALEPQAQGLLAHPGTAVAGVDRAGAAQTHTHTNPSAREIVAVNPREMLVRVQGARGAAPLTALLFIDRRPDGPEQPHFEPVADAQLLLAATFNFVLATPQRLRGLLEVCARAAQLRVERIVTGPATDAAELGAAITRRLSSPR